jgi:hypothetical protein
MTFRSRLQVMALGGVLLGGLLTAPVAAAPVEPVEPVEPTGVVQSWTLTAGGGPDGEDAGSRPNLTYQVAPGTTIDDTVVVYNFGNVTTRFDVYATDAFNNDDGQFDLLARDEVPVDVGSWVSLGATSVTLEPGKQATIPVTIEVPLDAKPGDHAGAIVAGVTAMADTGNGQLIEVERRTGTRIYLQVNGPLTASLAMADGDIQASYDHAVNSFDGAADVTFRVENRGNVRLSGVPTLTVSGPFGLGGTTITLPEIAQLLPGEDITVTTRVEGVPALLFMKATVSIEPKEFSGVGEVPVVEAGARFFAPPITVLLALLLVAVATMLVRAYRRHRGPGAPQHDGAPDRVHDFDVEPQLR